MKKIITTKHDDKILISDCEADDGVYGGRLANGRFFIIGKDSQYCWSMHNPAYFSANWDSTLTESGESYRCSEYNIQDILNMLFDKKRDIEIYQFKDIIEYVKWYEVEKEKA